MKFKLTLTSLLSILVLFACKTTNKTSSTNTKNGNLFSQIEWKDCELSDEVIIHKMAAYDKHLWGVSYGTGEVYKSKDQGQTWELLAELNSEFFEKVQFLNKDIGFVCGDYGYVYQTNNGGQSWKEISPPIENRIIEHYRLDSTKNQKPDGLYVAYYDMYFRSPQQGYVWGFKNNPSKGRSSFQLLCFITEDGGKNWQSIEKENIDEARYKMFEGVNKHQVTLIDSYYWSDQLLWKTNFVDKKKVVQRSTDGGKTWTTASLPPVDYERWMFRSFVFKNENEGFLFGGSLDEPFPKENHAIIFYTTDGGLSWQLYKNDWPHIHDAIIHNSKITLSGKGGLMVQSNRLK